MKIFKKLATVLLVATMSLSFTACETKQKTNETVTDKENTESGEVIIAKVGDISIAKEDLDNVMMQTDYYLQSYYGADFKKNAELIPNYNGLLDQNLEQLIGYELLIMKAKEKQGLEVTDAEIEEQVTATKTGFPTEEDFNSALDDAGMTLDEFKSNVKKDLYYQKMVKSYQDAVKVTDAEIEEYYNQNIANYTQKPGANVSHILVDTEDKAKEVLQKYKDGTSFADLAGEYGTDGTKTSGGSLGYIEYETQDYDADFMAATKKLGEGEVSAPVKTQFGWHLIKVEDIQDKDKVATLEEAKEDIKQILSEQKTNEAITVDIENWKKEMDIQTYEEKYHLVAPEVTQSPSTSEQESPEPTASTETSTQ